MSGTRELGGSTQAKMLYYEAANCPTLWSDNNYIFSTGGESMLYTLTLPISFLSSAIAGLTVCIGWL